ncbi:precorrin methylase [Marinibacterium profundimaris]|uniref:Precorrin methylase n=1 Tax=Marinibacterium profundimaris TaxID=1679460 RepID=A0A225NKW2_9RHOB|nr:precorrin methylase [Marinibacterium profundimaris]
MIAAGFGFREGAGVESLADALQAARAGGPAPEVIATLPAKAGHDALRALADRLALPLRAVAPDGRPTLTTSPAALAAHGTGSVAEAAALAAAGPGARLIGPRAISSDRMATCAIAVGETL